MRYIQNSASQKPSTKKDSTRTMAKPGQYKVSDLQAKGVKSGHWERKDD